MKDRIHFLLNNLSLVLSVLLFETCIMNPGSPDEAKDLLQWIEQQHLTVQDLNAVEFVDPATIVAVGDSGVIVWSGDGGNSWAQIQADPPWDLNGVKFHQELGFITGDHGLILKSTDQGRRWERTIVSSFSLSPDLHAIAFLTRTKAFASGKSTYFPVTRDDFKTRVWTTDAGNRWNAGYALIQGVGIMFACEFFDSLTGIAVGGTERSVPYPIARTTDGGASWTVPIYDRTSPGVLTSVAYLSSRDIVAVGFRVGLQSPEAANISIIVRSSDSGSSWSQQTFDISAEYLSVDFLTHEVGYVVGTGGLILRTSDGGKTWDRQKSGTESDLRAVSFSGPLRGAVVGANGTVLVAGPREKIR